MFPWKISNIQDQIKHLIPLLKKNCNVLYKYPHSGIFVLLRQNMQNSRSLQQPCLHKYAHKFIITCTIPDNSQQASNYYFFSKWNCHTCLIFLHRSHFLDLCSFRGSFQCIMQSTLFILHLSYRDFNIQVAYIELVVHFNIHIFIQPDQIN